MIQDGPYTHTPEKPLRITGHAEACEKAKALVAELIQQKEMEVRCHYSAVSACIVSHMTSGVSVLCRLVVSVEVGVSLRCVYVGGWVCILNAKSHLL